MKNRKKEKRKHSTPAGKDGNARLFGKIRFGDWRFFQKIGGFGLDGPDLGWPCGARLT
jgi:hypothetical protein